MSQAHDADATDVLDTSLAGPAAIRGSGIRTAAYLASILLSLAAAPLLIRHLGQEEFGRYFTVISLIAIVGGLSEAGLNTIAVREYSTLASRERDRLMANFLGMRLVLSAIGGSLAVGFAAVAGYGATLVLGTALAAVGGVLQVTQTMLVVPLQSALRFGWAAALEILRQVVTVLLIVALVVAGAGVVPFLAVSIPAGLAALVGAAVLVRRLMPLVPAFELGVWWPLLRDTVAYAVAIALNAVYFRLTVVIMSLIATELQTGYFSTSFRVVEIVIGVPALIMGSAFPILTRAARDDVERFRYVTLRLFEIGVIAGGLIVTCIVIGASFAVEVLGGSEAEPAAPVLRIQGVALVASFVTLACGFPLLALRRHRELLIANVVALTASAGLTLALVPSLEAEGAAIAAVSGEILLATANAVLLVRADRGMRLPLSSVPVALAAAAAGLAVGLVPDLHAVIGVALAGIAYTAVIAVLGRFPPELRHGFGPGQWRATLANPSPEA